MAARFFLVEDSSVVEERLRMAIEEYAAGELVGVADDEDGAIRGILSSRPDVVILDLQLRRGSGLNVLEAIRRQGCAARVIVQTNFALPEYRARCQDGGADQFLDKTHDAARLMELLAELGGASSGQDRAIDGSAT